MPNSGANGFSMRLGKWLRQNEITQGVFGKRVGVTQGRISQIVIAGTTSLRMALAIEKATRGDVTVRDLLMSKTSPNAPHSAQNRVSQRA